MGDFIFIKSEVQSKGLQPLAKVPVRALAVVTTKVESREPGSGRDDGGGQYVVKFLAKAF